MALPVGERGLTQGAVRSTRLLCPPSDRGGEVCSSVAHLGLLCARQVYQPVPQSLLVIIVVVGSHSVVSDSLRPHVL